jgi:uncharacterized membrane protein
VRLHFDFLPDYLLVWSGNAKHLLNYRVFCWLVFIEVKIVTFGWHFDLHFKEISLQVIWALGISMIVLAGLIHLPKKIILIFSCVLIFGHNLLDTIHFDGNNLWSLLHERNRFGFAGGHYFVTAYPLIPWIAVMSLGYCLGSLYDGSFEAVKRRKILNGSGIGAIVDQYVEDYQEQVVILV